jgi:MFS family permease
VPAGRLADRFGRKAGFILGLAVFAGASLGAGLSRDLWVLVAFRVLQAVGAAVLTPTSLGLVLTSAPPEKVASYVKIWVTAEALSAACGPIVGGAPIQASWRRGGGCARRGAAREAIAVQDALSSPSAVAGSRT